jgi:hypothetical protein
LMMIMTVMMMINDDGVRNGEVQRMSIFHGVGQNEDQYCISIPDCRPERKSHRNSQSAESAYQMEAQTEGKLNISIAERR